MLIQEVKKKIALSHQKRRDYCVKKGRRSDRYLKEGSPSWTKKPAENTIVEKGSRVPVRNGEFNDALASRHPKRDDRKVSRKKEEKKGPTFPN